jgi:arginine deiminase
VLIAGLTAAEFGRGRGVVYQLLAGSDFVVEPLPNLVFVRDCCGWIGDHVAVASPAAPDRRAHAQLTDVIYAHHPLAHPVLVDRLGHPDRRATCSCSVPGSWCRTNATWPPIVRLERCGIEVVTVPGSELCGVRGGPRSLCCPVSRDPARWPGDLSRNL